MTFQLTYYVYGLCGPDMHIRYVGLTGQDIRTRVYGHLSAAKKGKSDLHKWLMDLGPDLIAVELECVAHGCGSLASDREKWWISHAINSGCSLFNIIRERAPEKFKIMSREAASGVVPILKLERALDELERQS